MEGSQRNRSVKRSQFKPFLRWDYFLRVRGSSHAPLTLKELMRIGNLDIGHMVKKGGLLVERSVSRTVHKSVGKHLI
jgi:hypothetical protein